MIAGAPCGSLSARDAGTTSPSAVNMPLLANQSPRSRREVSVAVTGASSRPAIMGSIQKSNVAPVMTGARHSTPIATFQREANTATRAVVPSYTEEVGRGQREPEPVHTCWEGRYKTQHARD